MTRDDIIRMAEEAGVHEGGEANWVEGNRWELFANLVAVAVTKKAIEACHVYLNEEEPYPGFQNGVECCIAAIENREEFFKHVRGRDELS